VPAPLQHHHHVTGTAAPGLQALLRVQDLDTSLDQHRHRRATLDERAELAALDARVTVLSQQLATVGAQRDEVAGRQQALEDSLAATEARASDVHKRLYGGTVSATRELQAMSAELDQLTARASDLESRVLEVMEEREPADAAMSAIEGEKSSLVATRATIEGRLVAQEAEIDREIESVNAERAAAATEIPDELMMTYSRLRAHLGGVGAARLVGPLCGGCHLRLPASALDQMRRQPADTLFFCEQCGRILVRS